MSTYPDVVAKIANDYMQRVKAALRLVPQREREEFLREIESHLYEAYQGTPGEDEVDRILTVLRNMGEPAELVADRLPYAFLQTGTKRNLPVYIVGGILLALFGIPLGAGGVAVLLGVLLALACMVVAYYALVGSVLLVSLLFLAMGFTRIYLPGLWERLVDQGIIKLEAGVTEVIGQWSASEQGIVLIVIAGVFAAAGVAGLWLGKYLVRGLRFLFGIAIDWLRQLAQSIRRRLSQRWPGGFRFHADSSATRSASSTTR